MKHNIPSKRLYEEIQDLSDESKRSVARFALATLRFGGIDAEVFEHVSIARSHLTLAEIAASDE